MATVTTASLNVLLEKPSDWDKDERYMATIDCTTLSKDIKIDENMEQRICAEVLKFLDDQSNEVQFIAVKCLAIILKKVHQTQGDPSDDNQHTDAANELRENVVRYPRDKDHQFLAIDNSIVDTLRGQVDTLSSALKKPEDEIERLNTSIASRDQELSRSNRYISIVSSKCEDTADVNPTGENSSDPSNQLTRLANDLALAQAQLFPLRKDCARLARENNDLHLNQIKLNDSNRATVDEYTRKIRAVENDHGQLKLVVEAKNRQIADLETHLERIREAYSEVSDPKGKKNQKKEIDISRRLNSSGSLNSPSIDFSAKDHQFLAIDNSIESKGVLRDDLVAEVKDLMGTGSIEERTTILTSLQERDNQIESLKLQLNTLQSKFTQKSFGVHLSDQAMKSLKEENSTIKLLAQQQSALINQLQSDLQFSRKQHEEERDKRLLYKTKNTMSLPLNELIIELTIIESLQKVLNSAVNVKSWMNYVWLCKLAEYIREFIKFNKELFQSVEYEMNVLSKDTNENKELFNQRKMNIEENLKRYTKTLLWFEKESAAVERRLNIDSKQNDLQRQSLRSKVPASEHSEVNFDNIADGICSSVESHQVSTVRADVAVPACCATSAVLPPRAAPVPIGTHSSIPSKSMQHSVTPASSTPSTPTSSLMSFSRTTISELVQVPPELSTFAADPQFQQILLKVKEQTLINFISLNRVSENSVESVAIDAPTKESALLARSLIETHFKLQMQLKLAEGRLQKVQADLFSAQSEISGMMVEFTIPSDLIGLVIGKKGSRMKQIEQETGVTSIHVSGKACRICVTGPDSQSVQRARENMELHEEAFELKPQHVEWLNNRNNASTLADIKQVSNLLIARANKDRNTLDVVGVLASIRSAKLMLSTQLEYIDKQIEVEMNEKNTREQLQAVRKQYNIHGGNESGNNNKSDKQQNAQNDNSNSRSKG